MVYDNYRREHEPPAPIADQNLYPGSMDVESDYLIHSFQGQPFTAQLQAQPGDEPMKEEPLHMPVPGGKSSHENSFRRYIGGMTEEVSVWTVPDKTPKQLADMYRAAALDSGMEQLPSPNTIPMPPPGAGPGPIPGPAPAPGLPQPPRQIPTAIPASPVPPAGVVPNPATQPSTEPAGSSGSWRPGQPGAINLRFLRKPVIPTDTQPNYSPAQVLLVRVRPLNNGGSRLALWARYNSPAPTSTEPAVQGDGAATRP